MFHKVLGRQGQVMRANLLTPNPSHHQQHIIFYHHVPQPNAGQRKFISSLMNNPRVNAVSRKIVTCAIRRMLLSSATTTDSKVLSSNLHSNFRAPVLNQTMDIKDGLPTIVVAGAAGQLGRKIYHRLINTTAAEYADLPLSGRPVDAVTDTQGALPTRFRIILLDSQPCPKDLNIDDVRAHEVEYIHCDFLEYDQSWSTKFKNAYVAFLLATKVHFPTATSEDAYDSMLMNSNLLEACIAGNVERVVLGSSTDVVRGIIQQSVQKHETNDLDAAPIIGPGDDPKIPEKQEMYGAIVDSRLYAAAKVAAEAQARALVSAGQLNRVIVLRLGACYPIQDLAPNETAKARLAVDEQSRTIIQGDDYLLDWFRQVKLSDDDLDNIVDCCITPGLDSTPLKNLIFVNAVSARPGSKLRIENNELGYFPPTKAEFQPEQTMRT